MYLRMYVRIYECMYVSASVCMNVCERYLILIDADLGIQNRNLKNFKYHLSTKKKIEWE